MWQRPAGDRSNRKSKESTSLPMFFLRVTFSSLRCRKCARVSEATASSVKTCDSWGSLVFWISEMKVFLASLHVTTKGTYWYYVPLEARTKIIVLMANSLRHLGIWISSVCFLHQCVSDLWQGNSECDTRKLQLAAQYNNQPSAGRNGKFHVDRQDIDPRWYEIIS